MPDVLSCVRVSVRLGGGVRCVFGVRGGEDCVRALLVWHAASNSLPPNGRAAQNPAHERERGGTHTCATASLSGACRECARLI